MKNKECKQDWAEEEAQPRRKPNKVMANPMGSFEMSLFVGMSISSRNGQSVFPHLTQARDAACPGRAANGEAPEVDPTVAES